MSFLSIFGANLSALGFGAANIVAKNALSKLSVIQTLVIGTAAGSLLLFIISLLYGDLALAVKIFPFAVGMAILEVGLYLVLYKAFAVANLTVAVSIISTYPVFTFLISTLFMGEVGTPLKFLCILLVVIGALLTSINWQGVFKDGFDKSDIVKGLSWVLLTLAFHIGYFPLLSIYTEGGNWETRLFLVKIISFIIFMGIFIFLLRKRQTTIPERKTIFPTSMLGFLEVIGWIGLSFAYTVSESQVGTIIALGSTSPLWTAIGAYIFLKERLTILQYSGVLITLVGIIVLSL